MLISRNSMNLSINNTYGTKSIIGKIIEKKNHLVLIFFLSIRPITRKEMKRGKAEYLVYAARARNKPAQRKWASLFSFMPLKKYRTEARKKQRNTASLNPDFAKNRKNSVVAKRRTAMIASLIDDNKLVRRKTRYTPKQEAIRAIRCNMNVLLPNIQNNPATSI